MTDAPANHVPQIATVRGSGLLGVLPMLFRDPLGVYTAASRLGGVVRLRLPLGDAYFVSSPELIQEVLQRHARVFQRPVALRRLFERLGGDNLMTREGEAWLLRRRLMQPSFQRAELNKLAEITLVAIDSVLSTWETTLADQVCLRARLVELTQEVVARTLLGVGLQRFPELGPAFSVMTEYFHYRASSLVAPPLWLPTAQNRRVRWARRQLDQVTDAVLHERRLDAAPSSDLLSALLNAEDHETGGRLDDAQLRGEVLMLIGAGETTTSEALAFCFHLLGSHPEVCERVVRELDEVVGDKSLSTSALPSLPLLAQVIAEALRLFPPSYVLARATTEPVLLGGVWLDAGTVVLCSPYTVHRDPRYWSAPDRFCPERFAPGGEAERVPRYAYLPFGAGPRRCLGMSLAQLEMMLALGSILQRFELELPRDPNPRLRAGFALGLADGLPARIMRRTKRNRSGTSCSAQADA